MEKDRSNSRRALRARWITACVAALIGAASGWVSVVTAYRLLFEYIVSPRVKDAYIYPEWRYRIFDALLVVWCFDGLFATVLLARSLVLREDVTGWARRTTVLFFVGVVMLVTGGALGSWLRSRGL